MEKRILSSKTCFCGKEFTPRNSMQKFCSPKCANKDKWMKKIHSVPCSKCGKEEMKSKLRHGRCRECVTAEKKDKRGDPAKFGGKKWETVAREVRRINGNRCCICGEKPEKGISVDHIIPRRKMEQMGLDPHIMVNLACLCESDHGIKTTSEGFLFEGDLVGFCMKLARMNYPLGIVSSAFHAAGFSQELLVRIYGGIS